MSSRWKGSASLPNTRSNTHALTHTGTRGCILMHFFPFTGCTAAVHYTWLSNTRLCKCVCVALVGNVTHSVRHTQQQQLPLLLLLCCLFSNATVCVGGASVAMSGKGHASEATNGRSNTHTQTKKHGRLLAGLEQANTMSRRVHPHF